MLLWASGFDTGRFDHLYCDADQVTFPEPDQCPYKPAELLDDLLETEKLHSWHESSSAVQDPVMSHSNLNYHAAAFERADHFMRNVLVTLTHPVATL